MTDESGNTSGPQARHEPIEGPLIGSARFLTLFAVVGSLAASLLMFVLGAVNSETKSGGSDGVVRVGVL